LFAQGEDDRQSTRRAEDRLHELVEVWQDAHFGHAADWQLAARPVPRLLRVGQRPTLARVFTGLVCAHPRGRLAGRLLDQQLEGLLCQLFWPESAHCLVEAQQLAFRAVQQHRLHAFLDAEAEQQVASESL